ncbi:hypothetical protein GCM10010182_07650 [Actinomadura cremea]|nr:hypothetical protein GCM10010182_07650 [Actinomadura cremea]
MNPPCPARQGQVSDRGAERSWPGRLRPPPRPAQPHRPSARCRSRTSDSPAGGGRDGRAPGPAGRAHGDAWCAWLREAVRARGGGPLAIFDAPAERFAADDFRGCAAINAMVESADPGSAAHRVAAEHEREVTAYVAELLHAFGRADRTELAEQFMILIDGAIVTAVRERTAAPAVRAGAVAARLLGR